MGTSPPASALRPDEVRARRLLEDEGTRRVGTGQIQQVGNGKYANIPAMVAELLDVETGQEVDILVNIEQGIVMHQIIDEQENGQR